MRVHVSSLLLGYVLAILTICAVGLWNQTQAETWIGVNTISRHISPARDYNEKNAGIFLEHRSGEWGYQIGYYENSYNRTTAYAVSTWQPWTVLGIKLGGFAGFGTGYRVEDDKPRGGVSPLIGGFVSYNFTKHLGINLIVATSVVGLQAKVRW